MNTDRLLVHYEQVADTSVAVPCLRRFTRELAVRGRLVPQDATDEPASELLKRIAGAKAPLVKTGQIRIRGEFPTVAIDGPPFPIPPTWRWVRFGNIVDFSAGRTPARNESSYWNSGDHAWVSIADMEDGETLTATRESVSKKAAKHVFRTESEKIGTIIMSFKLTIGKIARLGIPAYHNDEAIISIRSYLSEVDPYLFVVLPHFARQGNTKGAMKGATLNRSSISSILIPLPPLAEQHRIVTKVDELMALCDRLEAARTERETTRNRLSAASLARLNAPHPGPATFQNHAAFALENLTPLTTRPDQVKPLRQTILNLAIRGKLVAQDPNDDPASNLVKRIADDRESFGTIGSLKKSKPLPPIDTANTPFELPPGWAWVRFPEIGIFGRGKSKHRPRNDPILYSDGKYPFIQTGDVARSKGLVRTYSSLYNEAGLAQSAIWPAGTLCITIAANIADSGILAFDACFPDSVVGLVVHDCFKTAKFFEYFIRTAKGDLQDFAPSTAQNNINLGALIEILIPLPPPAELHRIVAKVDELMALCDRLEESLATGSDTRGHLLDTILHDALNG